LIGSEGSVNLLMGNEAIARGAMEAGVGVVIGYPGTPSSEVISTLMPVAEELGIRVEWAVNEKVAFDIAMGVALAGARCLVTMKSAGLNVASDSIMSAAYGDVNGGLVVYVADDPGAHAGMEEQDSRLFTKIALLPMIDASDPQGAKDAVVAAFDYSEEAKIPIFVRSTSLVAHMRGPVRLGLVQKIRGPAEFKRDIRRFTRASPIWCMEQHTLLNAKIEKLRPIFERSKFNELHVPDKNSGIGVIASGVSWNYLNEFIARHDIKGLVTLRIGTINPLPERNIRDLIGRVDEILVLEELEPYIELHVRAMIAEEDSHVLLHGKKEGILPKVGEYSYDLVRRALSKVLGVESVDGPPELDEATEEALKLAPRRPLPFCPGCPHRATYTAIRQALRESGFGEDEVIITGDIGCTILGMHPPFNMCWTEVSMGASIGLACGLKYAGIEKPVIAAIGDSTFFHAGIPPTINAAWKKTGIILAVLDNQITAMTGHQPSPSSWFTEIGETEEPIKIESIIEAAGIKNVRVVDPYDLQQAKVAFLEALKAKEPSAIVLRRACSLVARRMNLLNNPSRVDPEKCTGCLQCIRILSCPAMGIDTDGIMAIDSATCAGCGVCAQICPFDAIITGGPRND
jgi:indolepyruvate ferredoxin oxidoreductase alpha subunit